MSQKQQNTKIKKAKILFVLEYYYPHIGGVEKLFKMLCEQLCLEGHDVQVLTNRYDSSLPKREAVGGVKIRRLGFYNRFLFTFFSLPYAYAFARKADVIHTTSFNAALPAFFAAKLAGKKIFITFHEAWGPLWKSLPFLSPVSRFLFFQYEKLILRFSFTKFIAVSDFTKKCLIEAGVDPAKIERIYNGIDYVDFEKFQASKPADFVFTYFGRLGPSKGLDVLMPAAKDFLAKHSSATLKLIIPLEKNPILAFVKDFICENKLENQVLLLHELSQKELFQEISSSSCVVIPSYSEGFCFAAAETVALGIPLISSNRGALKDVVSGRFIALTKLDQINLLLALENAYLENWIQHPIKKFELQTCIDSYLKLYH
jgi:glycosyltransferase involved in cell wall biosynthesis